MSEQFDMVEVKPEPNQSDELLTVPKNNNVVDNNSRQHEVTPESKNPSSILFFLLSC